jgi:hypothetical protein
MRQALMLIAHDSSYECTRACGCASHKPISAFSLVACGDMCFPAVHQPLYISYTSRRRISQKGRISARYRARANSHTVDLHTYRCFGGAAWLELRRNGAARRRYTPGIHTCNPKRYVLGARRGVRSLPNVRFGNLWGTRFRALNTPLYMRVARISMHRLICDGDICVPLFACAVFRK